MNNEKPKTFDDFRHSQIIEELNPIRCNLKISKRMVHKATIVAMSEVIREEPIKKRILALLEKAQKTYEFINPKEWNIAKFLIKGGKEREKSQYYTGTAFNQQLLLKKANDFSEEVVKPYISIVEDLLK